MFEVALTILEENYFLLYILYFKGEHFIFQSIVHNHAMINEVNKSSNTISFIRLLNKRF